jgi:superfamily II DNA or RNA helicase
MVPTPDQIVRELARRGWGFHSPLLPHQYACIAAASDRVSLHIWAPTGSGKKIIGAAWLCLNRRPCSVVVTRASDVPGWLHAIKKFAGLEAVALRGLDPEKGAGRDAVGAFHAGAAVAVTAWETLHPGERGEFFNGWAGWLVRNLSSIRLILDEAHYAKNPSRWNRTVDPDGIIQWLPKENRSAATMLLSRHAVFRMLMSATPVANKLHDLWAQLDLGEPGCYGTSSDFGMAYCAAEHNGYGWEYKGRSNTGELKARLGWSAKAVKRAEYAAHLPAVRYETITIPPEEQNRLDSVPQELRAALRSGDDERIGEALVMEAAIRKTSVTIRQVERSLSVGHKVVVFTGRRREVGRIGEAVGSARPGVQVWTTSGEDSPEARDKIRQAYMAHPGPCCLIATGHSMGESVDIQDTDHAILAMLPWTPLHLIQWIGRFVRLGGKRKCLVTFLIAAGTYDEEMRLALLDKLEDIQASIEDADALTYADALAKKLDQVGAMNRLKGWLAKVKEG